MPNDETGTPQWLFDHYNRIFRFTIDVCANHDNHKLDRYWTKEDDALSKSWAGEVCWMNPPYSRGMLDKWCFKAWQDSYRGAVVVGLVPTDPSTEWWRKYVRQAEAVWDGVGRIKFDGNKDAAKFGSALVLWLPPTSLVRKQARSGQ